MGGDRFCSTWALVAWIELELEMEMEASIPNPKFWLLRTEFNSSSQVQDMGLLI